MNEGLYASWLGLSGIPREAEAIPLERDLRLARLTGGAYHAAKISTGISVEAIARAKSDGASVTAGVSINHLSLNEMDVGEYRTFFRLSPPLRAEEDRLAMVEALRDGTIDADRLGPEARRLYETLTNDPQEVMDADQTFERAVADIKWIPLFLRIERLQKRIAAATGEEAAALVREKEAASRELRELRPDISGRMRRMVRDPFDEAEPITDET
jgi:hypothetical protein